MRLGRRISRRLGDGSKSREEMPLSLRNGFVRPGGVDQSGHQGDPGDSWARYHEQCPPVGDPQRLQHVDTEYSRSTPGGSRDLYVPGQHGSHEEPGNAQQISNYMRTIYFVRERVPRAGLFAITPRLQKYTH